MTVWKKIDEAIIIWFSRFLSANQVTLFRLIATIPIMLLWQFGPSLFSQWSAAILWSAFWYFDHVDGAVARLTLAVSNIGKRFDPFADKMIIFLTLLVFWPQLVHWVFWSLLILDIVSTIERETWVKAGEIHGANWFGKWKLFVQVVATSIFFLAQLSQWNFGFQLANIILLVAAVLAICSLTKRVYGKIGLHIRVGVVEQPET